LRLNQSSQQAQEPSRNLRRERRRWDDADNQALALGCLACADFEFCGGIHKKQNHFSCLDDCCGNPDTCDAPCPKNMKGFIERYREVDGFSLDNIPKANPIIARDVGDYIPLIYHGNRRKAPLTTAPIVALPLHMFYSRKTGRPTFTSRAAVEARFCLGPDTRIILVGSGRDRPIEAWWGLSEQRSPIIAMLRSLGIAMVTSPNYSVFTDEPRYSDLYNIKRIGLTWQEILSGGIPTALHINARTQRDYERLGDFIAQRPEVGEIAFEFGTGANWPLRRAFHVQQLVQLAKNVERPLRLIMIGGFASLATLAKAYDAVTYVDTKPFMKALHRQRLYTSNEGVIKGKTELTEAGVPVDALLSDNIGFMRSKIEAIVNDARQSAAPDGNLPMQTIPENELSGPIAQPLGRAARR